MRKLYIRFKSKSKNRKNFTKGEPFRGQKRRSTTLRLDTIKQPDQSTFVVIALMYRLTGPIRVKRLRREVA